MSMDPTTPLTPNRSQFNDNTLCDQQLYVHTDPSVMNILVHNTNQINTAQRLISKIPVDIYLLSEVNIEFKDYSTFTAFCGARGYHVIYALPHQRDSGGTWCRSCVVYQASLTVAEQRRWIGGVQITFLFPQAVQISTAYVRPEDKTNTLHTTLHDQIKQAGKTALILREISI